MTDTNNDGVIDLTNEDLPDNVVDLTKEPHEGELMPDKEEPGEVVDGEVVEK